MSECRPMAAAADGWVQRIDAADIGVLAPSRSPDHPTECDHLKCTSGLVLSRPCAAAASVKMGEVVRDAGVRPARLSVYRRHDRVAQPCHDVSVVAPAEVARLAPVSQAVGVASGLPAGVAAVAWCQVKSRQLEGCRRRPARVRPTHRFQARQRPWTSRLDRCPETWHRPDPQGAHARPTESAHLQFSEFPSETSRISYAPEDRRLYTVERTQCTIAAWLSPVWGSCGRRAPRGM